MSIDVSLSMRECECGCGESYVPVRYWQRFRNKDHMQKYWRELQRRGFELAQAEEQARKIGS